VLGRTSLIERRDGRFVVRDRHDIERLLGKAYRAELPLDRLMHGLGNVAAALNANDQSLACLAAVHLGIPDLPNETARNRSQQQALHREISGMAYTYHEILQIAKDMFGK
jgi:hypothetical protein